MNENPALNTPWTGIAPMRMELLESYHECLGSVCREKMFLMMTEAPPLSASVKFVTLLLNDNMPMFVAFVPGPTVVGWTAIYRPPYEGQGHVGRLGMGVIKDFRGLGLGTVLLERTLKKARLVGLERVELEVFGTNKPAIGLYRSFHFEEEGVKRRARKMDGIYEDIHTMALHL